MGKAVAQLILEFPTQFPWVVFHNGSLQANMPEVSGIPGVREFSSGRNSGQHKWEKSKEKWLDF